MSQIRSRQRVVDHGEVFTPHWMVESMLDLVKGESERVDSRFLESACGSGNFLVEVLRRKLGSAASAYRGSQFELEHNALMGLMSLYGIELLEDNVDECRQNLVDEFAKFLRVPIDSELVNAARVVAASNIVHGDALSLMASDGSPIIFPEWSYIGRGKFQRRDFRFEELTQKSLYGEGTLFESLSQDEIFVPERDYPPLTISEIARLGASISGPAEESEDV